MNAKYEITKFEPVNVRGRAGILIRVRATALDDSGEPLLQNDCSHCARSEFPHATHVHFSARQALAAELREKNHPNQEEELAKFDKTSPHMVRHLPKPIVSHLEAVCFALWDGKLTREEYVYRKERKAAGVDEKQNPVYSVVEQGFLSEWHEGDMTRRQWLDHMLAQELRGLGHEPKAEHPADVPTLDGPEEIKL